MTRQLKNKIYYIFIALLSILEISALIGAYAANHYTKARMGMLRQVIYLNGQWEETLPIHTIKLIALIIIIVLVILVFIEYCKKKMHFKVNSILMVLTACISLWTVYFLISYDKDINRAYYILSVCFILATVFQNIISHCAFSIKSKN